MIGSLLFVALQLVVPQDNSAQPDDIVVTAVRDTCTIRYADKAMSDAQFDARAADWKAGKPVRVIQRSTADFPCLRKIAQRLFAKGVTRIEFADPDGKPAFPFEPDPKLKRYPLAAPLGSTGTATLSGNWSDTRAREHSLIARTAAQMILDGKCADARKMALEQGDLDAAAAVVAVCRAQGQ